MKKRTATLLLLITAMVWGMGFVAQDVAADALGPFSFNGTRMLLAAVALLPVVAVMDRRAVKNGTADAAGTGSGVPFRQMTAYQRKRLLLGGAACDHGRAGHVRPLSLQGADQSSGAGAH